MQEIPSRSIFFIKSLYVRRAIKRSASSLVLAEHNTIVLAPITRNAISAARQIGGDLSVLVAGIKCGPAAEAISKGSGLKRVIVAENEAFIGFAAESITPLILALQKAHNFTHILSGASTFSRSVLPRVAAKMDISPISDVMKIKSPDTFVRPVYAGSGFLTLKAKDAVKILTVRGTSFEPDKLEGGNTPIENAPEGNYKSDLTIFVNQEIINSDRPDLSTAKIVISGGRALQSAENFKLIYDLAAKFNAAVGASRAAVDAGFVSNELQIGQTGKIVAPSLYIAIGISGAIQHLAGMKDSKTIVAINKDADAPIFQMSDYGLVADLFKAVPELIQKL